MLYVDPSNVYFNIYKFVTLVNIMNFHWNHLVCPKKYFDILFRMLTHSIVICLALKFKIYHCNK